MAITPSNTLLIVGALSLDSIQTPSGAVEEVLGGAGFYSSLSASFFGPTKLSGVVGSDFDGNHLDALNRRGVETSGVQIVEGKTFRWKGSYGQDFGHVTTLSTELNVLEDYSPVLPATYKNSRHVFIATNDPSLQMCALEQVERPEFCLCDTMNLWIDNQREPLLEFLRHVHALSLNDEEAQHLCGTSNLIEAANIIHSFGPTTVIVKRGEHGALLSHRKSIFLVPGFPLSRVVDPTGAGDALAGGLMGYLNQFKRVTEEHLRRGLLYGNVMASFAIEGFGIARLQTLTREEIQARYSQLCQMTQLSTTR